MGLVEVHPYRFTAVTEIDAEVIRETRQFAALQTAAMARLAIPRLGEGDRAWASQLADEAAATIHGGGEWLPAHARLLEHLFRRTENRLFSFLLEDLWFVVLRNLTQTDLSMDERVAIATAVTDLGAAILAADVSQAEAAARRMFGNFD
ncbi:FCD domain-containing protein [Microbacterium saperdae]|uniref:FCD domain-containing protein n=1 Tax=Microbacterium saperdae TaxID=69368 RepID=A0A543BLH2_9MICO|nr:FCD domain-containing protein [Microbacterium saperdae]